MDLLQFKNNMSQLSINDLLLERKKISDKIIATFTYQHNIEELIKQSAIIDDLIEEKRSNTNG